MHYSASFHSREPEVVLTKAFATPFANIVATARTCYSSRGIVHDDSVNPEKSTGLVKSVYEAGHHTTIQHAHFQFALNRVSRQCIWEFMHAHPFYNSEQVSQRYVKVSDDMLTIPNFNDLHNDSTYGETVEKQFQAYHSLCKALEPIVEEEFFSIFQPSERMAKAHRSAIEKKAQEIARYVLPVSTQAYFYHTISAITLFRYWRMANTLGVSAEVKVVVKKMIDLVLQHEPKYREFIEDPLESDDIFVNQAFAENPHLLNGYCASGFTKEFDDDMGGYHFSRMVNHATGAENVVASAVREVLGMPSGVFSDEECIAFAMDPGKNKILAQSLNLTTMDKMARAMHHASYTFKKRLSHTADSQDQRHRMTPGSRPVLAAHIYHEPDFIIPPIIQNNPALLNQYEEIMERTWTAIGRLKERKADAEKWVYLLPNAVTIRFTESSDLLNLRHKYAMRLCFNAQEEIWRASMEEVRQIREAHPIIGQYLLPPCTLRKMAGKKPYCPEGPRFCGVRVWTQDIDEYARVL